MVDMHVLVNWLSKCELIYTTCRVGLFNHSFGWLLIDTESPVVGNSL